MPSGPAPSCGDEPDTSPDTTSRFDASVPIDDRASAGRRERKKLATRRALADAAIARFAEHGFDATTIEEIAEAVDVSPRTFHRHFRCKEDVLFVDNAARVERLRASLARQPLDRPVLEGVRDAILEIVDELADRAELERVRTRIVMSSPALRAHNLRYQDEWALAIAEHVARREGGAPSDLWPSLVGRCTLGVLASARPRWTTDPSIDLRETVRESFALLDRFVTGASVAAP